MGIPAKSHQTKRRSTALSLVLLSDSHELHREIDVPCGDILIHAGDFTMFGRSLSAIEDFNAWLGEMPHRIKIVVPGNHEYFLEADQSRRLLISNAIVLINEGVEVEGLRIWGSPATPLYGGAFGLSSSEEQRRLYAHMPATTNVLITHGPPHGILDVAPGSRIHSGSAELLEAVQRIRPRLHVFGHVHGAYGIFETEHTTFVNAALAGPLGDLAQVPIVLKMTATEDK
jgi:Icc-related predicted phosphoesterase